MEIEIRDLSPEDERKAIELAISNLNFEEDIPSNRAVYLYMKNFWIETIINATDIIAAYYNDQLVGVLAINIYGKPKINSPFVYKLNNRISRWIGTTFFGETNTYDEALIELSNKYKKENDPDGEILFLAVSQDSPVKDVYSKLLDELENREEGKLIFLYTDSSNNYSFYEQRGFNREAAETVKFDQQDNTKTLEYYLYSKKLGDQKTSQYNYQKETKNE